MPSGARRQEYRKIERSRPFPDFLDALDQLTAEDDEITRLIHRRLAEPIRVPKRNVVVLHAGEPVLATTLRLRAHFWEPATTSCAPFLRLPHQTGHLEAALAATRHEIVIPEYFGEPTDFREHEVRLVDCFAIPLQGPPLRSHWSHSAWRDVVKSKNRTSGLTVALDDPTTLEWLIARWEANWAYDGSDEIGVADDLRVVWREMLDRGRLKTVTLLDAGKPVAANAMVVWGSTLVSLVTARDLSWPRGSLGTRVLIESMEAARAAGFERLEVGGYHRYKQRFAPSVIVRPSVHIRPGRYGRVESTALRMRFLARFLPKRISRRVRSLAARTRGQVGGTSRD